MAIYMTSSWLQGQKWEGRSKPQPQQQPCNDNGCDGRLGASKTGRLRQQTHDLRPKGIKQQAKALNVGKRPQMGQNLLGV